ncbi:hypothetical protein NEMBOFW57_008340 [Staphylotrichum longicolle]|uniref:Uncharacterized protein n=1 Tax=Staphylotrichum longicolle TaxID=669026 RepID=A0AAD4ERG5_9PEZI|nr:hypothetical protein NEMBOFW57_008340 [Staphylotrichum longicolle]
MGDEPTPTAPKLERKGSSFHTQTLTQILGPSTTKLEDDDELRVEDEEQGEEQQDLPLPGPATPVKQAVSTKKGKNKGKAVAPNPHTPSDKRIKINLDEVPSSQPTPFTPMLGYSPIASYRSPLTQKSTNVDAPLPTVETVSKLPRNLVIQDSYSMGSSVGFPSSSSAAAETPTKEETTSQVPKREPLAEIPVASLELGVGSTPVGETPTARRKRMFVEIPDSDDELESIGSTPARTRSTQQTPLKREVAAENFEVAADPGSATRSAAPTAVSETPASTGRSDKENESPAIKVWGDAESTASEGSPTPRLGRKSQTAAERKGRASQVSPNTASQFWAGSMENLGHIEGSGRPTDASTELAASEEPTASEEGPGTPTPAPRPSQFHGSMGGSGRKTREATPQLEDAEDTASEAEEEFVPTSILRKAASQKGLRAGSSKKRNSMPGVGTSESSTDKEPSTPTPVVRRVQIALPPPSTAEEVYKETPRKAHKSSPLYQHHTQARSQARSQYYSQGLESQRVPMEVIRSLGPQTDRSDIIVSIHADIMEGIVNGTRNHEFRNYKFPVQVSRCWIYTTRPVGEVKYMATIGPAQEPGQIDSRSGVGNAEFNDGTSGHAFAHKLLQVYQLNNPVPLEDMADNGLGDGPPQRYRYIPPAVVGQLLANLRCPLFDEEDENEDAEIQEDKDEENDDDKEGGGVTISQELAEQLRSDIVHSTQLYSSAHRPQHRQEEDDFIPASQSPLTTRSTRPSNNNNTFTRPPIPAPAQPATRSSQRLRNNNNSQHSQSRTRPRNPVRPSQATTASDASIPSSSALSPSPSPSPASQSRSKPPLPSSSPNLASVPRPPLPESSEVELLSLPPLPRLEEMGDSLLVGEGGGVGVVAGV